MPPLPNRTSERRWHVVIAEEFARLGDDADHGRVTLLDQYGATNEAEFFAVATECFFERPVEMARTPSAPIRDPARLLPSRPRGAASRPLAFGSRMTPSDAFWQRPLAAHSSGNAVLRTGGRRFPSPVRKRHREWLEAQKSRQAAAESLRRLTRESGLLPWKMTADQGPLSRKLAAPQLVRNLSNVVKRTTSDGWSENSTPKRATRISSLEGYSESQPRESP